MERKMDDLTKFDKLMLFAGLGALVMMNKYESEWTLEERAQALEMAERAEVAGKQGVKQQAMEMGMDAHQLDKHHARVILDLMKKMTEGVL
jgi:uncharacterized protein YidB (DUF937 family)